MMRLEDLIQYQSQKKALKKSLLEHYEKIFKYFRFISICKYGREKKLKADRSKHSVGSAAGRRGGLAAYSLGEGDH